MLSVQNSNACQMEFSFSLSTDSNVFSQFCSNSPSVQLCMSTCCLSVSMHYLLSILPFGLNMSAWVQVSAYLAELLLKHCHKIKDLVSHVRANWKVMLSFCPCGVTSIQITCRTSFVRLLHSFYSSQNWKEVFLFTKTAECWKYTPRLQVVIQTFLHDRRNLQWFVTITTTITKPFNTDTL